MSSLVVDLQKKLISPGIKTSDILREAYVLATKLEITEFQEWIYSELNGYKAQGKIPEYRSIRGTLRAWNPYHGWQPVICANTELEDKLRSQRVGQSIPEIEDLLSRSKNDGLTMVMPGSFSKLLEIPTEVRLNISESQVVNIIESAKNILLEWSLKLEKDGIRGNDYIFSEEEVKIATDNRYTVNYFMGNVTNSQIQQDTSGSLQSYSNISIDVAKAKSIMELLANNITALNLDDNLKEMLALQIKAVNAELASAQPKNNIIIESLCSIRNILEGIAGSLIASGIIYEIHKLLLH